MKKSPRVILLVFVWLAVAASATAQMSPRCAGCGNIIITGDYYEVDGQYYHHDHFVCDHCLKPISEEFFKSQGRYYHKLCYQRHVATVCSVCNRVIEGECKRDYWGNSYHTSHYAEKPECNFCGRLVFGTYAAGKRSFADGRNLCGQCAATAVTRIPAAESLLVRVLALLAQDGVFVQRKGINVLLLDRYQMQRVFPGETRHVNGFTDYASPPGAGASVEFAGANLCLLYGMPETEMMSIIAHELMHSWQGAHNALQDDDVFREGSAGFAEYLVMARVGSREAQYIIHQLVESDDPEYGEGFRRVKRFVDTHGTAALLQLMATEDAALPEGPDSLIAR